MNSFAKEDRAEEMEGCRVEVSGWDAEERFFVEQSLLVWTKRTKF